MTPNKKIAQVYLLVVVNVRSIASKISNYSLSIVTTNVEVGMGGIIHIPD